MDKRFFESTQHRNLILILIVISFFLLMFGNGIISLTHPDEVFYIQSAKEMVKYNKWFTPMIFDDVQFEKPFVSFMLFAAGIKWFGLSPFVSRFWPAFFGILGVCVVYWISFMLFGKKRQAFLSSFVLTTSFIYMALSRAVLTDMIFSVLVAISIGFFCLAINSKKYHDLGLLCGFAVTAISVLTKGLLGFIFPWTLILLFLIYKKNLSFLKDKLVLLGFLLFLAISLPWHIVMFKTYGNFFLNEYFGNVHIRRIFESEHSKIDTWYFYLGLMFAGVMPWSLFWLPILWQIRKLKHQNNKDGLIFIIFWIFTIFIFVEPAHSKLASYIFPVFPAISILFGFYINKYIETSENNLEPRGFKFFSYIMSFVLIIISICSVIFGKFYLYYIKDIKIVYIFSFLLIITSLIMFIFNKNKKYLHLIFSFGGINIALLVALFYVRPAIEPWVSCKDVSREFNKIDQSDSIVLSSKFYVRAIKFYTDRKMAVIDIGGKGFWSPHPVLFLNTDQKVLDFLSTQPVTYAIVKESNVEDLMRLSKDNPLDIQELGGEAGKFILKITKK